jgi:hypothetical protein
VVVQVFTNENVAYVAAAVRRIVTVVMALVVFVLWRSKAIFTLIMAK